MSTVFAYALLHPDGDCEVLNDMKFIRASAPDLMKLLQQWPTMPRECEERKLDPTVRVLAADYFSKTPETLAELSPDTLKGYQHHLYRQILFGSYVIFSTSPEVNALREGLNGRISETSSTTLAESFGGSLKALVLKMASGRLKSPDDLIASFRWKSTGVSSLEHVEARYKHALIQYLRGKGIVCHPVFDMTSLTPEESAIAPDDPCARGLMFLMTVTGTLQLPPDDGQIEFLTRRRSQMNFIEKYKIPENEAEESVERSLLARGDPLQNPDHWILHASPVQAHTCFDGVDLPLLGVAKLLDQSLPENDDWTDFDVYQYTMYRPVALFAEFGGLAVQNTPELMSLPPSMVRVPNEVWGEIFLQCLPAPYTMLASHLVQSLFLKPSSTEAPLLLCRVSGQWRAIVFAAPGLWTSLNPQSVLDPRLVHRWLQRALKAPLSISIQPSTNPDRQDVTPHLKILIPTVSRCHDLEVVEWFRHRVLDAPLPPVVPLRTVSVSIDHRDVQGARWFTRLLQRAPALSRMHWMGPRILAPWSQLTYLSFSPCDGADLERVCVQLKNLTELQLIGFKSLTDFNVEFSTPPDLPHVLPNIKKFSLHHTGLFLDFITLPVVEKIIFLECDAGIEESIIPFLDRSACRIGSLELQDSGSSLAFFIFDNTSLAASLTYLSIGSEDLSMLFSCLEDRSPGTLPQKLHLLRSVDRCFQIDILNAIAQDETTGVLASLIHSYLPHLSALDLDPELFASEQMESRSVVSRTGSFCLVRPTCLLTEYEAWWASVDGQEFQALWSAGNSEALDAFHVEWDVVSARAPPHSGFNLFANPYRVSGRPTAYESSSPHCYSPAAARLIHGHTSTSWGYRKT
ncbi:hypothetical protein B0H10DRAFT_1972366 [Mycena sp. CBHHK59/15]|nr:hypothetical protein B0H10DRAFT_1972366 [Mycena sp. CBHHK59/15]